jgi:hypothetical protein
MADVLAKEEVGRKKEEARIQPDLVILRRSNF